MAWYDMECWEGVIREHSVTNTTKGFIRALTRFCATRTESEATSIVSQDIHYEGGNLLDTRGDIRVIIWMRVIRELIQNPHYGSQTLWKYVSVILQKMDEYSDYAQHTQREIKEYLSMNIPLWYARGLKDGSIPMYESDQYYNSCYCKDTDTFQLLRGMGVYDEFKVSMYMPFEDADEYRALIRNVFMDSQKTAEDVSLYLSRVCNESVAHLGTEEWLLFAHVSGYDSLLEFVVRSGVQGDVVAMSSLPLDALLELIGNAYEEYYNDDQRTVYESDEDEPRGTEGEQGTAPISRPFYNPLELVSGMSSRPDITYEIYKTRLVALPWWNLPVPEPYPVRHEINIPRHSQHEYPHGAVNTRFLSGVLSSKHEHVFRDFMEHKDEFRDIICSYVEREGKTHSWNIFCCGISGCRFLTIDDVLDLPEIDWDWELLSRNPSVATPGAILAYPELPWEWGRWGISSSPSITPEFVMEYWENGLNFGNPRGVYDEGSGTLSGNHSVTTQKLIEALPDKPWSYAFYGLSTNDTITLPWFIKHIQKPWNPVGIVCRLNPDQDLAARAIQSWWRILRARRRCAWLASEVEEWWYNPDCKPASRIRSSMWKQHYLGAFE